MRKTAISLLVVVAFGFLSLAAVAAPVGTNDQQVKAVAEPILENLLAGFNQGDYAKYSKDFDATLREALPEQKFKQVREDILKKFGKYQDKKFLGFLNQGAYTVALWKGTFAGTKNDILIKLVLSKRQDKVVVIGLWFQ